MNPALRATCSRRSLRSESRRRTSSASARADASSSRDRTSSSRRWPRPARPRDAPVDGAGRPRRPPSVRTSGSSSRPRFRSAPATSGTKRAAATTRARALRTRTCRSPAAIEARAPASATRRSSCTPESSSAWRSSSAEATKSLSAAGRPSSRRRSSASPSRRSSSHSASSASSAADGSPATPRRRRRGASGGVLRASDERSASPPARRRRSRSSRAAARLSASRALRAACERLRAGRRERPGARRARRAASGVKSSASRSSRPASSSSSSRLRRLGPPPLHLGGEAPSLALDDGHLGEGRGPPRRVPLGRQRREPLGGLGGGFARPREPDRLGALLLDPPARPDDLGLDGDLGPARRLRHPGAGRVEEAERPDDARLAAARVGDPGQLDRQGRVEGVAVEDVLADVGRRPEERLGEPRQLLADGVAPPGPEEVRRPVLSPVPIDDAERPGVEVPLDRVPARLAGRRARGDVEAQPARRAAPGLARLARPPAGGPPLRQAVERGDDRLAERRLARLVRLEDEEELSLTPREVDPLERPEALDDEPLDPQSVLQRAAGPGAGPGAPPGPRA